MQLHRSFAKRVVRPGKDLERQIDERAVEGIQFILEAKAVPWRLCQAASVQMPEQRLVKRSGLLFVDPPQRCTRHRAHAEMIQTRSLGREVGDDITQAV